MARSGEELVSRGALTGMLVVPVHDRGKHNRGKHDREKADRDEHDHKKADRDDRDRDRDRDHDRDHDHDHDHDRADRHDGDHDRADRDDADSAGDDAPAMAVLVTGGKHWSRLATRTIDSRAMLAALSQLDGSDGAEATSDVPHARGA